MVMPLEEEVDAVEVEASVIRKAAPEVLVAAAVISIIFPVVRAVAVISIKSPVVSVVFGMLIPTPVVTELSITTDPWLYVLSVKSWEAKDSPAWM